MLKKALDTYPHPIAYSYGRYLRAHGDEARLAQLLRCAEVTTRYLASLAIASFAARIDSTAETPSAFSELNGNLNWGDFNQVVCAVVKSDLEHPLRDDFSRYLRRRKNVPVLDNLEKLLGLRNQVGHSSAGLRKFSPLLKEEGPQKLMRGVFDGIEPLCSIPLFRVENLPPERRVPYIHWYPLMGEQGDPIPVKLAVSESFADNHLYVGIRSGVLSMHPMAIWEPGQATTGVHFIHRIGSIIEYDAASGSPLPSQPPSVEELTRVLRGECVPLEPITLADGSSFIRKWVELREHVFPGSLSLNRWDKGSFLSHLDILFGRKEVRVAQSLLNWAESETMHVEWGDGSTDETVAISRHDGSGYYGAEHMFKSELEYVFVKALFILSTKGELRIRPDHFTSPFDLFTEKRSDLFTRLNAISGVFISEDKYSCTIPLSVLGEDSEIEKLMETLRWYAAEIRRYDKVWEESLSARREGEW